LSAFFLLHLTACNRDSSGGDVMAAVNGHKIYRTEVDKYFANQTAGSDQQPTGEQAVSMRLSILSFDLSSEKADAAFVALRVGRKDEAGRRTARGAGGR